MRMKIQRYFLLTLTIVLTLIPHSQGSNSCNTRIGWGDTRYSNNCYQHNDGTAIGVSTGNNNLRQCYWSSDCAGDWNYEFDTDIAFIQNGGSRTYSWNYCTCSACGCKTSCWYDPNQCCQYNSCYQSSKTTYIWRPCHWRCSVCTSNWNAYACTSCWQKNGVSYKWIYYSTYYTNSAFCDTSCPNLPDRGQGNDYTGQYIASVSDTTCNWCDDLCAKCSTGHSTNCQICVNHPSNDHGRNAYLYDLNAECLARWDNSADCKRDKLCETSCQTKFYFPVSEQNTGNYSYFTSAQSYRTQGNLCLLCHRFCETCTGDTDKQCTECYTGYYKWRQADQTSYCQYYCYEGQQNGRRGEYISFNSASNKQCSMCDVGCRYCADTSNNCSICQDTYYLLDDKTQCYDTFEGGSYFNNESFTSVLPCKQCRSTADGGVADDGCHTKDRYCRADSCPQYFYFATDLQSNDTDDDLYSRNTRYDYWTKNASHTIDDTLNGYMSQSAFPASNSTHKAPNPNTARLYRYETNFCKLCDYRCIKCHGPDNTNCTLCRNGFWKWTHADVCETYCIAGQFTQELLGNYPDNQTKCAICDTKCSSCLGYSTNCSTCFGGGVGHAVGDFLNSSSGFYYEYEADNTTCLALGDCPERYYNNIGRQQCQICPLNCKHCNINYVQTFYSVLQEMICKQSNTYCTRGIQCTSCADAFIVISGKCLPNNTCGAYSYYQGTIGSVGWLEQNCKCHEGYSSGLSDGTSCSIRCHLSCKTCSGTLSNQCLSCTDGYLLENHSCVEHQVLDSRIWESSGTQDSALISLSSDVNNPSSYKTCGSLKTFWGYRSLVSSRYVKYQTQIIADNNYGAIHFRVRMLFIGSWPQTNQIHFTTSTQWNGTPDYSYSFTNKSGYGQQLCGTNEDDYVFTIDHKINLSPQPNQTTTLHIRSSTDPSQDLTSATGGFYNQWGLLDLKITMLKCYSDCLTCSGSQSNQCRSCINSTNSTNITLINGTCISSDLVQDQQSGQEDSTFPMFVVYGGVVAVVCGIGIFIIYKKFFVKVKPNRTPWKYDHIELVSFQA